MALTGRRRLRDEHLPVRMYRHGRAYRVHLQDGSKVPLGRDLAAALARYHVVMHSPPEPPSASPEDIALTMWRRHKKGARQRKLTFTVSADDIRALLVAQGNRCAVTALAFRNTKPAGVRIRPWLASLDRIEGARGYEPGNCRVVCAFVNVAMNGFGEGLFREVLAPLIDAAVWADRAFNSRIGAIRPENGNQALSEHPARRNYESENVQTGQRLTQCFSWGG